MKIEHDATTLSTVKVILGFLIGMVFIAVSFTAIKIEEKLQKIRNFLPVKERS